ncbi:hypothetical protein CHS0354_009646, partial [Potamilus streckersoni]
GIKDNQNRSFAFESFSVATDYETIPYGDSSSQAGVGDKKSYGVCTSPLGSALLFLRH